MAKTSYTACATSPVEIVSCAALDAANYPAEYSTRVDGFLQI